MMEEQIIPRLLARSGEQTTIVLKRFHSYGLGESHVDSLLAGVDALVPDGSLKLGFRAHYPQLETKLTVRGADVADVRRKLEPVEREIRKRLGNFILGEDDKTLEGVILEDLSGRGGSLVVVETFTGGQIAARLVPLPGAERVFRPPRHRVARSCPGARGGGPDARRRRARSRPRWPRRWRRAARRCGATHAWPSCGPRRRARPDRVRRHHQSRHRHRGGVASRRSRVLGGREWVRLGATELGMDCLRRYLQGLPVVERIDFEKT